MEQFPEWIKTLFLNGSLIAAMGYALRVFLGRELARYEKDMSSAEKHRNQLADEVRLLHGEHEARMRKLEENRVTREDLSHMTKVMNEGFDEIRESMMATFINGNNSIEGRITRLDQKFDKLTDHLLTMGGVRRRT